MSAITLNLHPTIELTDKQFALICSTNRDLQIQQNNLHLGVGLMERKSDRLQLRLLLVSGCTENPTM